VERDVDPVAVRSVARPLDRLRLAIDEPGRSVESVCVGHEVGAVELDSPIKRVPEPVL
jgi:hypothetical protein